jgi:hypothetical protein
MAGTVSFFESGPTGFVYVIQMWFRYYFKNHIADQPSELESNESVLQLDDAPKVGVVTVAAMPTDLAKRSRRTLMATV